MHRHQTYYIYCTLIYGVHYCHKSLKNANPNPIPNLNPNPIPKPNVNRNCKRKP